jgi:NADH:ubiquinone oxidoreductase subunit H
MAPVATFMLSMAAWAVVPFDYGMVLSDLNIGQKFYKQKNVCINNICFNDKNVNTKWNNRY